MRLGSKVFIIGPSVAKHNNNFVFNLAVLIRFSVVAFIQYLILCNLESWNLLFVNSHRKNESAKGLYLGNYATSIVNFWLCLYLHLLHNDTVFNSDRYLARHVLFALLLFIQPVVEEELQHA